ncbi:MAG: XRE family transcriptional regulator [Planctomycetota bacterium]|nr:MAG: XRE family transcriptional regulator [Planctomycetota bacterium]
MMGGDLREMKASLERGGMAKVLDEIRRAIERSGESRYAISKATGIGEAQLSRLMAGQAGLSINRLELLADHLGLEIIIRPKRRRKASK